MALSTSLLKAVFVKPWLVHYYSTIQNWVWQPYKQTLLLSDNKKSPNSPIYKLHNINTSLTFLVALMAI